MSTFDEDQGSGLGIETVKAGESGGIALGYGGSGTGKSALVANASGAKGIPGHPDLAEPFLVIVDAEGSNRHYHGARVITPRSENHLFEVIHKFGESTDPTHKVLAIDTVSQFYTVFVEPGILRRHGADSLASIPYGKGNAETLPFGKRLCDGGDFLASKGKWLMLLAHSQVRTVNDPQHGSYDRHGPKLPGPLAEILIERADVVAFMYRALVTRKTSDGKQVAVGVGGSGGERLLLTQPTATVTAKSRFAGGVDGPLPLVWSSLGIRV